jgi:hypothetical protein
VFPYRFTFRAMGGEHELQLCAGAAADARRAADAAIADVARIEAKYSRYRPGARHGVGVDVVVAAVGTSGDYERFCYH